MSLSGCEFVCEFMVHRAACAAKNVIYENIKRSKKPRSCVPGDVPRRIVQEFGPELATPAGKIFRNIVKTGQWPKPWRVEYGTPLQKTKNPVNEDQLGIISLTSYLSKQFEQFVITLLLERIGDKMDWGQYGGVKGSSILVRACCVRQRSKLRWPLF